MRPVGSLAFMTIDKSARKPRLVPYGYTLAILTVLNAFNFLDRQIITILAEPIKAEFKLADRSEEHTSELQSLMRISYAVFCLKKKTLLSNQHHDSNTNIPSLEN